MPESKLKPILDKLREDSPLDINLDIIAEELEKKEKEWKHDD